MLERVLFAGGGTGGHIYMAVALAETLKARRAATEVLFVGTRRGLETRILPALKFPLATIRIGGLKNVGPLRTLITLLELPGSLVQSRAILRRFSPSLIVGLGGYASGPVLLAGRGLGLPSLLIEPNVQPGFTNRLLSRWVDGAAVAFEETRRWFGDRARVTGIPVRAEFHRTPPPPDDREGPLRVLIFGGSQGSRAINRLVCQALPALPAAEIALVHQTGLADFFSVRERYQAEGREAEVIDFIQDMPGYYRRADLIVARSGALTVAEITAAGKPSLLIPFARAAEDHQRHNARALARQGAALLLEESTTSGRELARTLLELARDRPRLRQMAQASRRLAHPESLPAILAFMEELQGRRA